MKSLLIFVVIVLIYFATHALLGTLAHALRAALGDTFQLLQPLFTPLRLAALLLSVYIGLLVQGSDTTWVVFLGWVVLGWFCLRVLGIVIYEWYCQRVLEVRIPGVLRGLTTGLVLLGALFAFLHISMEVTITSLLVSAAVIIALITFLLQGLLQSFFQGISIVLQKNLRVGDYITIDQYEGEVVGLDWQTTQLRTADNNTVVIPNRLLLASPMVNYRRPGDLYRAGVTVTAREEVPPNRVTDLLMAACTEVPGVLSVPPPEVLYKGAQNGCGAYLIYFWIADRTAHEHIAAGVTTLLWYRLRRERMLPHTGELFPPQELIKECLSKVPFLAIINSAQLEELSQHASLARYGRGEFLFHQGDPGDSFFIVKDGLLEVRVDTPGGAKKVAACLAGDFVGERSLLTGESRNAHVLAVEDSELIIITKEVFFQLLQADPNLADQISNEMLRRAQEHEDHLYSMGELALQRSTLAARIRAFFGL